MIKTILGVALVLIGNIIYRISRLHNLAGNIHSKNISLIILPAFIVLIGGIVLLIMGSGWLLGIVYFILAILITGILIK
jgi:hypothetical protein